MKIVDYDIVVGSDGKELLCPYCHLIKKFITLELYICKFFLHE